MATGGYTGIEGSTGGLTGTYWTETALNPNTAAQALTTVYSGAVYAIQAYGGYSVNQQFDTIHRLKETVIGKFDVTGSVEVLMDVRLFNYKIGIYKDAANLNVKNAGGTPDFYTASTDQLNTDSFTLSANEFVVDMSNNLGTGNIVSVGIFSTIYSDFAQYVSTYFGLPAVNTQTEYGFATLFSGETGFNPNNGVFDAAAFAGLLYDGSGANPAYTGVDGSGASISTLAGSINIAGITQLLRNAVDSNPFGNRNSTNGTTASDPYDRANYGVTDGFLADDLFFIPSNGFQITLNLAVDQEAYAVPLNNVGSAYDTTFQTTSDASFSSTRPVDQPITGGTNNSISVSTSTSSSTLISRTISAPLLIRLANLTTDVAYDSLTSYTMY
jgi:hypothetical protein